LWGHHEATEPLERFPVIEMMNTVVVTVFSYESRQFAPEFTLSRNSPIANHCVILEMNVPSYRAEQAKKARQARPAQAEGATA
jgi:hypothetical protein